MRLDELILDEMQDAESSTFLERVFKRVGVHITNEIKKSMGEATSKAEVDRLSSLHERILMGGENGNSIAEKA